MRLAILGATGGTGVLVVQQALDAGHQVKVLVRTPSKVTITHDNLEVVKANIFSAESLSNALEGCEAVISALGSDSGLCSAVTFYSESIVSIVEGMRAARVPRLVVMSSSYARASSGEGCCACCIRGLLMRHIFADMSRMEDYLQETANDLQWTAVKPWVLKDKPLDPRRMEAFEGEYVPDCISGIPRANVAKFLVGQVSDNTWYNKAVAIGVMKD